MMLFDDRTEEERAILAALLEAWEGAIGIKVKVTSKHVVGLAEPGTAMSDALFHALRVTSPGALGRYLSKVRDRNVGGRIICMRPDLKHGSRFWLEREGDGPWNNWGY